MDKNKKAFSINVSFYEKMFGSGIIFASNKEEVNDIVKEAWKGDSELIIERITELTTKQKEALLFSYNFDIDAVETVH